MAVVTKWFKAVDTKILEAVDDCVLRNYESASSSSTAVTSTARSFLLT
jgi:hypothetical protein